MIEATQPSASRVGTHENHDTTFPPPRLTRYQACSSLLGNEPFFTADTYAEKAARTSCASRMKFRTNFAMLPRLSPSISCMTKTWPVVPLPAPMPIVAQVFISDVKFAASSSGTLSRTIIVAPTASSAPKSDHVEETFLRYRSIIDGPSLFGTITGCATRV